MPTNATAHTAAPQRETAQLLMARRTFCTRRSVHNMAQRSAASTCDMLKTPKAMALLHRQSRRTILFKCAFWKKNNVG